MVQSQFSLSWDAYKSNICGGFSSLQQNAEFVDMTLAADGHFVKVHQVLMALVSPYLKEIITSAPCQHPVIFLNNVSHKTLCSLLEYIYTGEVLIHSDNLSAFVETAKNLHIKGLEDLTSAQNMFYKMGHSSQMDSDFGHNIGTRTISMNNDSGTGEVHIPPAAKTVLIKREGSSKPPVKLKNVSFEAKENITDYSMEDSGAQDNDSDNDFGPNDSMQTSQSTGDNKELSASNVQYSVSIRGSLQVILNRYIYNLMSTKQRSGLRRWRCVDYRNLKCMAFVVTKDNVVVNRANLHNHPFHDKKILQKIEKKAVFSALDEVQNYKEKEIGKDTDNEATMEQEEYGLPFEEQIADVEKKWPGK